MGDVVRSVGAERRDLRSAKAGRCALERAQRRGEVPLHPLAGHGIAGSPRLTDETSQVFGPRNDFIAKPDFRRARGGLGPMDDQYNIDPKQHRESMKKLARYDFESLICGHGPPIRSGAGKQLKAVAAKL